MTDWSAFFSAILHDLRSFHPGTCLNTKIPRAFRWNERFLPAFPSSLFSGYALDNQPGHGRRKRLRHEVNFLPTASGTVDQCTILTLSPQRHLFALKCYQWGRDAVKLTVKRIIKDLRVANFQDEYTKISFWGLWGWITAFKITGEKFILIKNTFLSAKLR